MLCYLLHPASSPGIPSWHCFVTVQNGPVNRRATNMIHPIVGTHFPDISEIFCLAGGFAACDYFIFQLEMELPKWCKSERKIQHFEFFLALVLLRVPTGNKQNNVAEKSQNAAVRKVFSLTAMGSLSFTLAGHHCLTSVYWIHSKYEMLSEKLKRKLHCKAYSGEELTLMLASS